MAKQLQGESEQSGEARLFIFFFFCKSGISLFFKYPTMHCLFTHHSEKNIAGTVQGLCFKVLQILVVRMLIS